MSKEMNKCEMAKTENVKAIVDTWYIVSKE